MCAGLSPAASAPASLSSSLTPVLDRGPSAAFQLCSLPLRDRLPRPGNPLSQVHGGHGLCRRCLSEAPTSRFSKIKPHQVLLVFKGTRCICPDVFEDETLRHRYLRKGVSLPETEGDRKLPPSVCASCLPGEGEGTGSRDLTSWAPPFRPVILGALRTHTPRSCGEDPGRVRVWKGGTSFQSNCLGILCFPWN